MSFEQYYCVSARFHFFNGKQSYTVEFMYGLSTWYIFKEDSRENALWKKKINPPINKSPNRDSAESILLQYLDDEH